MSVVGLWGQRVLAELADYDLSKYVEWISLDLIDASWMLVVPGRKARQIRTSYDALNAQVRSAGGEMFFRPDSLTGEPTEIAWYTSEPMGGNAIGGELPDLEWTKARWSRGEEGRFWQGDNNKKGIIYCAVALIVHDALETVTVQSYKGHLPSRGPSDAYTRDELDEREINDQHWRDFFDWAENDSRTWPHDRKSDKRAAEIKFSFRDEPIDLNVFF